MCGFKSDEEATIIDRNGIVKLLTLTKKNIGKAGKTFFSIAFKTEVLIGEIRQSILHILITLSIVELIV